jgi:hypothetical protein
MSQKRLPDAWVRRIFATMQGHYGTRFLNMWKTGQVLPDGSDAGVVNAMNHWADKLGRYVDMPDAIKTAMDMLPPEPPSLPQFQEILRRSHRPVGLTLPHKETEAERERAKKAAAEAMERIKKMVNKC